MLLKGMKKSYAIACDGFPGCKNRFNRPCMPSCKHHQKSDKFNTRARTDSSTIPAVQKSKTQKTQLNTRALERSTIDNVFRLEAKKRHLKQTLDPESRPLNSIYIPAGKDTTVTALNPKQHIHPGRERHPRS